MVHVGAWHGQVGVQYPYLACQPARVGGWVTQEGWGAWECRVV